LPSPKACTAKGFASRAERCSPSPPRSIVLGYQPTTLLARRSQGRSRLAGLDEATLRRMLAQLPAKNDSMVLKVCAKARCDHRDLVFAYRHVGEVSRGERCVAPLAVRLEDDVWYLDGFDRARGGRRTFRIDHMSDARVVTSAGGVSEERNEPSREVRITFRDEHYLTLLHWKHLEIISRKDGETSARIPYFGGMWLPRMIAACSGTATTDDHENQRPRGRAM